MKCSEIRDLLSAYIDGVVDEAEKTLVEQHISTCSSCRQELTDLRGTVNLLQNLGEVSPPPDFRLQLRKRLEEENTGGRGFMLRQRIRRLASGPWKYAAAAVVILGLGVSMGVMNLRMGSGLHSYAGKGSSPEIALSQSYSHPSENQDSYDNSKNKSETGSQGQSALPDLEQMKLSDRGSEAPSTAAGVNGQAQTISKPQSKTELEAQDKAVPKPEQEAQDQAAPKTEQEAQDRASKSEQKIIRDGSLVLEVDRYRDFGAKLPALVEQYHGYIEKSDEVSGPPVSANFTVRVPAASFTELFNRIALLGTVITKQVSGRDVTGEYVDVQARLRSLQTQEARLLGLVDKAGTVSDVVSLESELGRIRGEIEVLQGRLKVLDNTIVYSTIRLEVREVVTSAVQPAQGVLGKTIRNFKNSIASMVNLVGDLVAFMGWFLPWAILLGGIGGGIYYYRKKAGRKN